MGAATGLGLLAKSFPALLVLPVVAVIFARDVPWRRAIGHTIVAGVVAVGVALPWTIYTWWRWPAETARETVRTVLHVSEVVDAVTGGPLVYVQVRRIIASGRRVIIYQPDGAFADAASQAVGDLSVPVGGSR